MVVAKILMPLPDAEFDLTECAVPWKLLTERGFEVVFATERGKVAAADPTLIDGVIFGQLGAEPEPIEFYRALERDAAFGAPIPWESIVPEDYAGLWLAGGHAPGMRQYLGSEELQQILVRYWQLDRPIGAICHGVLPLARAKDPATGRSVLAGRRTTCLPKYMERIAYYLTAWKLGKHYRTYPAYVQDEVADAGAIVERGPINLIAKGTRQDDSPAFTIRDRNYLSGRWPGDVYLLAKQFADLLAASAQPST